MFGWVGRLKAVEEVVAARHEEARRQQREALANLTDAVTEYVGDARKKEDDS